MSVVDPGADGITIFTVCERVVVLRIAGAARHEQRGDRQHPDPAHIRPP